jgi:hypothetical protein
MRRYRPWVEAHISKRSVRIIDRLPAEFRRESILITLKSQLLPVLGRLKAVHRACSTATVENIVPRRPSPLSGLRNIWTRRAGHRWHYAVSITLPSPQQNDSLRLLLFLPNPILISEEHKVEGYPLFSVDRRQVHYTARPIQRRCCEATGWRCDATAT